MCPLLHLPQGSDLVYLFELILVSHALINLFFPFLKYVKSDVYTVNCGMAYGQAAMLLSLGTKGYRAVQPNSSSMTFIYVNNFFWKILLHCFITFIATLWKFWQVLLIFLLKPLFFYLIHEYIWRVEYWIRKIHNHPFCHLILHPLIKWLLICLLRSILQINVSNSGSSGALP